LTKHFDIDIDIGYRNNTKTPLPKSFISLHITAVTMFISQTENILTTEQFHNRGFYYRAMLRTARTMLSHGCLSVRLLCSDIV